MSSDRDLNITTTDEEEDVLLLFENPGIVSNTFSETFFEKIKLETRPNPATNYLIISCHLTSNTTLRFAIYDSFGRLLYKWKRGRSNQPKNEIWPVPKEMKPGLYLIEMQTDNQRARRKFIVAK